jgi:two-component system response regulator TctD
MRLLLVEDNPELATWLTRALEADGYAVDWLDNGATADALLARGEHVLAILDLCLPGLDGLEVLRRLRQRGQSLPVLVLTARSELSARVEGLNLGADDYLAKPFELDELRARLHALLRRSQGYQGQELQVGALTFDGVNRSFYLDDEPLALSRREAAVLEVLVGRVGRVVSKDFLFNQVFALDDDVNPEAIEVYVSRLRRKLAGSDLAINTLRGLGYLLAVTSGAD